MSAEAIATTPPPATANPAAPAPATTAAQQPGAQPAANQPQTVTIPLEQLQTFTSIQARLAQIEAEGRQRELQAQQEQAAILAKKGEVENALNLVRQQSEQQLANERAARATVEERAKRYALDGELSRALASQPLVPGGAEQLTQLWRSQFVAEPQGDSFTVRTPTFQSVGDFVAAQLGRPEYAHFVRAQNPGGGTGGVSPASQTAPTQPAQTAAPEAPKTLSEAVILTMKDMKSTAPDGRTDMQTGFGLRRAAR
jgi:hypothetical protein